MLSYKTEEVNVTRAFVEIRLIKLNQTKQKNTAAEGEQNKALSR